jgi:uncharacterized protein (TIGR03067 family)
MNRRSFVFATLCAASLGACTSTPSTSANILGRWQPVSAQLGGRELPIASFRGAALILQPGTYEFGNDSGTFTQGNAGPPAQMDIQGKVGPNAGKTILAIYSLQQDELVICYQLGAGPRPSAFESPAETQVFLVKYKRVSG